MSIVAIVCVWLAFVLPLAFAAIGRHRATTKLLAGIALAFVFFVTWLLIMMVLGNLAAHSDSSSWPSPATVAGGLFAIYAVVAVVAFRRKLA